MTTSVAFFDLDNTMIRGGSLFHIARGLMGSQKISKRLILSAFWKHLKFVVIGRESSGDMDEIRAMALSGSCPRSTKARAHSRRRI